MKFTHRSVGPRKGTGTIDVGRLGASKRKRRRTLEVKEEMRITVGTIVKANRQDESDADERTG